MVLRRILVATLALIAVVAAGCAGDTSTDALPDGATLIRDASAATRDIDSAHFTIDVNGSVPGIMVHSLDGDLTKDGDAKGTGTIEQAGQLVEIEFVLTGDTLYLKGPTGGYRKIPAALSSTLYDPAAVLDPERGVAELLASLKNPTTEGVDEVDGIEAYTVTGTLPRDVLAGLLPGVGADADVTFWLRRDDSHLPLKASASFPGDATVDITVSDVDKPVTVTPPA